MTGRDRITHAVTSGALLGLTWIGAAQLGVNEATGLPGLDATGYLVALGALVGGAGGRRLVQGAAGLTIAAVLLVSASPVLGRFAYRYVRSDALPSEPVDAIVVLSGSVSGDGDLGHAATDRLLEAIHLLREGVASRLVLSRVYAGRNQRPPNSDADQDFLLSLSGLAPEVHRVDDVGSTRLEAVRMDSVARQAGWGRLVVVTSPTHTRRACAAFEKLGRTVICHPSADRGLAFRTLAGPTDRMQAFGLWLYEALAWAEYRIRGWA